MKCVQCNVQPCNALELKIVSVKSVYVTEYTICSLIISQSRSVVM